MQCAAAENTAQHGLEFLRKTANVLIIFIHCIGRYRYENRLKQAIIYLFIYLFIIIKSSTWYNRTEQGMGHSE